MAKFAALAAALLIGLVAVADAKRFQLAWNDPDNDPSKVDGYKLYWRPDPGAYQGPIDVGRNTTYLTPEFTTGSYCFAITAYNLANESPKSEEACGVVEPPIEEYVIQAPATLIFKIVP